MDLEKFPRSDSAKRMLSYVTKGWYDQSYVGKWLYEVMGIELDRAQQIVDELPYQMFVETATWGLAYHEIKWGLPVRERLSYEERRRLIYIKRDECAPMTPYRMEVILKNLTGREAHVDDLTGPVNTFIVEFESGESPIHLAAVINQLNEIKQSHVTFSVKVLSIAKKAQIHAAIGQHLTYKPPAITDGYLVIEEAIQPAYIGSAARDVYRSSVADGYSIVEETIHTAHIGGGTRNIHRSTITEMEG